MDYTQAINEVLYTEQSITDVASKYGIYVSTLSKRVKQHVNITTIQDIINWCKIVDDSRKIISFRDTNTRHLWDKIIENTNFLPKSATLRERLYYIENNTTSPPKCVCGNDLHWNTTTQKSFNLFCNDRKCKAAIEAANEKRQQTNIERSGVPYVYMNPIVKQKRDNTMIERYGTTSFNRSMISAEIRKVLTNKQQMEKLYATHKSTFEIATELGVSQSLISKTLSELGIETSIQNSNFESSIREYINSLGVECIKTRDLIYPKEIDIFIPSHKIAFECDGIYWHSETHKPKNYHKDKTAECLSKGVRLIHIFEHEYINKPEIVKSRISNLLGKNKKIGARHCYIKEVEYSEANKFFNETHIQGECKNISISIGLYYNDVLISCMSFSKSRFNKKYDYELVRYSSSLFTNVIGGASKLFSYFTQNHPKSSIVSYSDNRWNNGNLYRQLGFVFSHVSSPNYFYFKNGHIEKLFSRVQFQKHKLPRLLENYDPSLSEYSNMKMNGYDRIWDCGNTVWVYPSQLKKS